MKNTIICLLLAMLVASSGCGEGKQVTGKVTYGDGSPVTVGQVAFVTDTFYSYGQIKPDGTYVMGSKKANDGLPPGTYKVYLEGTTIVAPEQGSDPKKAPKMVATEHVAVKYLSPTDSGLTCEVQGNTVFDIKVEKP